MTTRKSLQEHDLPLVVKDCIFIHTKPWELQDFDPKISEHLDQLAPGTYRVHPEVYHMLIGPSQGEPPVRPDIVLICDENVPKGLAVRSPQFAIGRKN